MECAKRALLAGPAVLAAVAFLGLVSCQDPTDPTRNREASSGQSAFEPSLSVSSSSPALTASLSPGAVFTFAAIPGLSRAFGINDAGLVVGDLGGNNIAAIWTASGGVTTIGRLDHSTACCSSFTEVNGSGEASGWSHTNVGVSAVLWSSSSGSIDLNVPNRAYGQGLNNARDVVGFTFSLGSPFSAYFRPSSGSSVLLQLPPGAASTFAYDINNNGLIVGESDIPGNGGGHALLWQSWNAAPMDLGTLGGATSRAWTINDAGDIVGWAQTGGGQQHAFLWTSGSGMVDLTTWPNGCSGSSEATAVNNAGVIVGRCDGRPVLWTAMEGMRNLPLPSGVSLGDPQAINGTNQIVGIYAGFGAALWTINNQPPVADAGGPYTGTIGTPLTFSSAGSSDPDSDPLAYSWDFGDAGTASETNPEHTYADPGPYVVTLTVSDPVGASSTATATVTIAKAVPTIHWPTPGSLVLGQPYGSALNATATGVDGAELGGTFTYRNAAGQVVTASTIPPVGTGQALSVEFAPTDEGHYTIATAGTSISVAYDFSGFFSPVNNQPVVNTVNSGQAIPAKFSLGGNQGLDIFQPGSPTSVSYACSNGLQDAVEETVTANASGLTYDEGLGQYTYVWKTEKAWAKTCRKLVLTLRDGTSHQVLFHFTK